MPSWVWTDAVLSTAGRWLALLHQASAGFDTDGVVWQVPAHEPVEVVCLNDVAPYNMVFDEAGRLSGWIDVDTASPGPRAWDLAHLAYRLVPLTAAEDTGAGAPDLPVSRRRLAQLCAAYADVGDRVRIDPGEVVKMAVTRLHDLAEFTAARAAAGAQQVEAHVQIYLRDAVWIDENRQQLASAW